MNTLLSALDYITSKKDFKNFYWLFCSNPNLTWKYISTHPSLPWDYRVLSGNPAITYKRIRENPDLGWDEIEFIKNPNASLEVITELLEKCSFEDRYYFFMNASKNPNITIDFLRKHAHEEWNYYDLCVNGVLISFDDLLEFAKRGLRDHTFPLDLSYAFSKHVNLRISDILSHPEIDWNWDCLSRHHGIMMRDILEHDELPWNWSGISCNPNVNIDILRKHMERDWDWGMLSVNQSITIKDVLDNPSFPWEFDFIYLNPNITCEDADFYRVNPIDMLQNPNVSWEYIKKHNLQSVCIDKLAINKLYCSDYYSSNSYKKLLVKRFMFNVLEELISVACTPERTPNWTDDWGPDHPLWGN